MLDSAPSRQTEFLGLAFDNIDINTAIGAIVTRLAEPGFAYVVTPNADHVVRCHRMRGGIRAVYVRAWLRLNDSRVIQKLGHAAGIDLECVPGSDLVEKLLGDPAIARTQPVCVVGSTAAVVSMLKARYGLERVTHVHAPMGLRDDLDAMDVVATEVEATLGGLILLCVGSPQQEILAHRLLKRGRVSGVALAIGAGIDFLTGAQQRAPAWAQWMGLEWAHRLAGDPIRLWRRYLVDSPAILSIFARERLTLARRGLRGGGKW